MLFPGRDHAPDQHPEEPVSGLDLRARAGTERGLELVAQEQVLDHQVLPLAEEPGHGGEENAD